MKFNTKSHIEEVVSKDASRYTLTNVHLDMSKEGEHCLVATNGRMLAVLPVETEQGDAKGPVTMEALKLARKEARKGKEAHLTANGNFTLPSGATLPRSQYEDGMAYPNWRQCIPTEKGEVRIAFNAELLAAIASAVSTNGIVTLSFQDAMSPIFVKGNITTEDGRTAHGVLMPCRMA